MRLSAPGTLEHVDVPEPRELCEGEVLVAPRHGGICGSDLPYFRAGGRLAGATPPHGFPLHEITGEVTESRDAGLPVGTHVVGWASSSDGLAELVISAGDGLCAVPPSLTLGAATVVAQPLACVHYAVDQLGDVRGKRAAVVGLGPIGLLFAWVLRQRGAHVTGVDPVDRTAHAAAFGLDDVVVTGSAEWARELSGPRPDVVIEAVGHQRDTLADAITAVADQGAVYCFGIPCAGPYPVDLNAVVRRNLRLIGGLTLDRRRVLVRALDDLVREPALAHRLVTHVVTDVDEAFALASEPGPGRLKVVLDLAAPAA
ncbi:zinc-dependent alcohol dehydrogenase [Prauserella cavernicola]|uniref:Zinc-binding dehydrogenase n=1 Tax=Prauserella cavernicola TaxID=2800127 RepID=A0A934QQH9_9PSEU|nr:zinc-binding dehydrogenase [Prauserella cavernicola]MBK1784291.1 zinc-binding dehydrogenase [Prauserella cavernicola]